VSEFQKPKSEGRAPKAERGPKTEDRNTETGAGQSLLTSAATMKEGGGWLMLSGASKNNLKDLAVRIPLGRLVLVTGVSGSGKSTLIRECLLPALKSSVTACAVRPLIRPA